MLSETELYKQLTPDLIEENKRRNDLETIWFVLIDHKKQTAFLIRKKYNTNRGSGRGYYNIYNSIKEEKFLNQCKDNLIPFLEINLSEVVL